MNALTSQEILARAEIITRIETIANAAGATAGVTFHEYQPAPEVSVRLLAPNGRGGNETFRIARRRKYGQQKYTTEIGWYSSSSNSDGTEALTIHMNHGLAAKEIADLLEASFS